VLLVNPFYPKDPRASFAKHVLTPSLALTTIAGATPASWQVRYWDENLLQGEPPWNPPPEVVGITVHLTFAARAYELARWYRAVGSRVVLGGLHVTACPDEASAHADVVVTGDGVGVWPQVLADLRAGRLRSRYDGSPRSLLFRYHPRPRRDLLPRTSFLTTSSVIATRGCHNRCDFCCLAIDGLAGPYETRPVAHVVREILDQDQPYTVFVDNNLGSKPEYLRSLCAALRPLGHIWSAAVTIDVTDQPSLVREMALAGCTGVFVGFESLDGDNLREAGKRTSPPSDYARRVGVFHDHGIQVNGSFVLGFDHDRRESFHRLVEWIEDTRLECATFQILTPYPGTPLFERLQSEGRILHRDWSLYDTAHAVFRPRHMEPEELEEAYASCYARVFSPASIWRRRPRSAAAVLPYLGMSFLYKRCNPLWALLIRYRLVATMWRPLVHASRRRHLRFRARLEAATEPEVLHAVAN
jgi:radical SAM superfamily enzyme YgiQ (UPF0313 family)